MATVKFIGAAQEVTGSCHLVQSSAFGQVLLDCGMHQGGNAVDRMQNETFAFDPATIDAVILSHAHIDHSGLLPKLVHDGFRGSIHCTQATADLLDIMLNDSVGLYERDLERENRWRARKGQKPTKPSYVRNDVIKALKLCKPHGYKQPFNLSKKSEVVFHDAGHILGSAIVELRFQEQGKAKVLVFSGDLGNRDTVLMNDPEILQNADLVIMEGTYGDRDHRPMDNTLQQFRDILGETWKKGGNIMIPAFAVGRTQELLFYLGQMHHRNELDNWQIFLDSPMAIAVTKVYDHWLDSLDCEGARSLCDSDKSLLKNFLPRLQLSQTPEESMAINKIAKGALIIAGSGMCTGGRIQHHFKHRIWNKRNTLIFVGFQARNTLGRQLVDGSKHIKLFREEYIVKANIETLGGFSAHGGKSALMEWVGHFTSNPKVVLVHGEPESLDALSQSLWEEKGIDVCIPVKGQSVAF